MHGTGMIGTWYQWGKMASFLSYPHACISSMLHSYEYYFQIMFLNVMMPIATSSTPVNMDMRMNMNMNTNE